MICLITYWSSPICSDNKTLKHRREKKVPGSRAINAINLEKFKKSSG